MNNKGKDNKVMFEGTIIREIFSAENFKIYAVDFDDVKYPHIKKTKYGNAAISGDLYDLTIGVTYQIEANESYGKNGYTYQVTHIKRDKPSSAEDTFVFLQEILTYSQAENLYQAYPNIVDKIINDELDDVDLSKVKGVKDATFAKIKDKVISNFCLLDLVAEFKGYLNLTIIKKLYSHYSSVNIIKQKLRKNPYNCLCNLSGIGFKTADEILLSLEELSNKNKENGEQPIIEFATDLRTSKERCYACMVYLLEENETNGHTYMDITELREQIKKLCNACVHHYADCLKENGFYFNLDNMRVALSKTYQIEKYIADNIIYAINNPLVWEDIYQEDYENYKVIGNFNLTDEQHSILSLVRNNSVAILNGAGGVGKTSSVLALISMLKDKYKSYLLFSPTGKAAKVLAESTNSFASTIHRGLCYSPIYGWGYNEFNKLTADIVIVDEFSMTDIHLFKHIIDAIDFSKTKLLLIGDNAQIPSVGAGNLLHDFMQSKVIPTLTLTKVFRYNEGGLMTVATETRMCRPYLREITGKVTTFGSSKDYAFIQVDKSDLIKTITEIYKMLLQQGKGVEDIQVLSAYKKGDYGTNSINNYLQIVANKNYDHGSRMIIGETTYYVGDLVIQIANNYSAKKVIDVFDSHYNVGDANNDNEVFIANGETGIIKEITSTTAIIDFDGVVVEYQREDMEKCALGYAISIHKSQGSSIKNVILVTPSEHSYMLNSNLIYVGLTRTKEKCYHIGSKKTVDTSIKKQENLKRKTFMQDFLKGVD